MSVRHVPRPRTRGNPNGRVALRLPKTLHSEVAEAALAEGVSVNTFLVAAVAMAVGRFEAEVEYMMQNASA